MRGVAVVVAVRRLDGGRAAGIVVVVVVVIVVRIGIEVIVDAAAFVVVGKGVKREMDRRQEDGSAQPHERRGRGAGTGPERSDASHALEES